VQRNFKSKRHVLVGKWLLECFTTHIIIEECRLDKILRYGYKFYAVPKSCYNSYMLKQSRRYFVDWVILDLLVAIEIQGEQHYRPVGFGSKKDLREIFADQMYRDKFKKEALNEAGFRLVEVPYNVSINRSVLLNLILP